MRAAHRARRREATRDNASTGTVLAERIMALTEVSTAISAKKTIGCYLSLPHEPSTHELRNALRQLGAQVVVPRVVDDTSMEWCVDVPQDVATSGIPVPLGDVVDAVPDVLIIPALAIDEKGNRLGQGGGYYDRVTHSVPRIAIIFDDELVALITHEEHDVPVDIAITPTRTVRFTTTQ